MSQLQSTFDRRPRRCAIGVDIGGTKTAAAIVTQDGRVLAQESITTRPERGGRAVASDVWRMAKRLLAVADPAGPVPEAIGISVCELVDDQGELASDATLKWRGMPIRQRFSGLRPTVIEADSRAAALAEARCGAGRGFASFLYVTVGTGISCNLVIDGRPYTGARGITGTMASGALTGVCSSCGQLSTSVLERLAAGPAIAERYARRAGQADLRCESVLAAADAGDVAAQVVLDEAATSLGSVVALLVDVLDPHAVVVGGGLGSAGGRFWESLEASTRQHIWSAVHRELPMVQAALGADSALIGAALVALEKGHGSSKRA
jgi:glucokinase